MADLPEFVYLLTTAREWPVSVIVDYGDDEASTAQLVASEVERRTASQNVLRPDEVRIHRARLTDIREVVFTPATVVPPSLTVRES